MLEFYMIFAQKNIFPDFFFWGGATAPCPRLLRLWLTRTFKGYFLQTVQSSNFSGKMTHNMCRYELCTLSQKTPTQPFCNNWGTWTDFNNSEMICKKDGIKFATSPQYVAALPCET